MGSSSCFPHQALALPPTTHWYGTLLAEQFCATVRDTGGFGCPVLNHLLLWVIFVPFVLIKEVRVSLKICVLM